MVYDRTQNVVSLAFDNPANGAAPVTPGSSTIVSNSQCTLNGANTTVVFGLTIDCGDGGSEFQRQLVWRQEHLSAGLGDSRQLRLCHGGRLDGDGWRADRRFHRAGVRFWCLAQFVTFTVSDSASQLNITGMSMLITAGAPSVLANACYLVYNRLTATIGLYHNDFAGHHS